MIRVAVVHKVPYEHDTSLFQKLSSVLPRVVSESMQYEEYLAPEPGDVSYEFRCCRGRLSHDVEITVTVPDQPKLREVVQIRANRIYDGLRETFRWKGKSYAVYLDLVPCGYVEVSFLYHICEGEISGGYRVISSSNTVQDVIDFRNQQTEEPWSSSMGDLRNRLEHLPVKKDRLSLGYGIRTVVNLCIPDRQVWSVREK